MKARTWQEYGEGSILDRADSPEHGPAIRAYARPSAGYRSAWWEVTAESPSGAITMATGVADDLDHARELAQAALVAIAGCL